ncbi:MAG: tetratricopeptide repeat protein [Ferruginibacter sp.]
MKKISLMILCFCAFFAKGQDKDSTYKENLLKQLAENACKCIDSINHYNKAKTKVAEEANICIKQQTMAYQLGIQLSEITTEKLFTDTGAKKLNISININENSDDYKTYYYEIERYLMENCSALKEKIATNEKHNEKSMSKNKEALNAYSKGIDEYKQGLYQTALPYFEEAVKIDPEFAFAWDNIGVCYRKIGEYDKALKAYKKSLEIDPEGITPMQNMAIVYRFKKKFKEAIATYERLAKINKNDPEVYYGIGQIYAGDLGNIEKGLDNMCKAYNLYVEQKSPYRTDAEKFINLIFTEMKKQNKEQQFYDILKENNIRTN